MSLINLPREVLALPYSSRPSSLSFQRFSANQKVLSELRCNPNEPPPPLVKSLTCFSAICEFKSSSISSWRCFLLISSSTFSFSRRSFRRLRFFRNNSSRISSAVSKGSAGSGAGVFFCRQKSSNQFCVCTISPLSLSQTPCFRSSRSAICNTERFHWMGMPRITNGRSQRAKKRTLGEREGRSCTHRIGYTLNQIKPYPVLSADTESVFLGCGTLQESPPSAQFNRHFFFLSEITARKV